MILIYLIYIKNYVLLSLYLSGYKINTIEYNRSFQVSLGLGLTELSVRLLQIKY
jgi:hypothetical protein